MKIEVWAIGKSSHSYIEAGVNYYNTKIKHYLPFEFVVLPEPKQAKSADKLKSLQLQADLILSRVSPDDYMVLLDEKGRTFTSVGFSTYLNRFLISSSKRVIFLIGGAYGFHEKVYALAKEKLSLSTMTLNHDMVRLFILEQIYRGCSILKNEPYHNN
jgi:23S rRNA (pseudouridine1915-N3)-methyltransferase